MLLEILKLTIPSLVVFLTIYFVLKSFFKQQVSLKQLDIRQEVVRTTLPMKLQAYERLSLFCERISIPSLILRLHTPGTDAHSLQHAMQISIQKEFEHNITQQMYISEQLWQILRLATDQTVDTINIISRELPPNTNAEALIEAYYRFAEQSRVQPLDKALSAIKHEASVLLA